MINTYHLKYFCDACRFGSISEAARRNQISHSAVSQSIRSLEDSIGIKLLAHAKRHFEITSQGHVFRRWAEDILLQMDSLPSVMEQKDAPISGKLKIGLSLSLWTALFEKSVSTFLLRHPLIVLALSIGNSRTLANQLSDREIDLGFGVEDESFAHLGRCKIAEGKFVLVSHPDNVNSDHYVLGDKGKEVRAVLRGLKEKSLNPKISVVESWSVILSLVSNGSGIGLLPDFCLAKGPKLKRVSRMRLPPYKVFAFYRSKGHLSPVARAFMTSIGQTIE